MKLRLLRWAVCVTITLASCGASRGIDLSCDPESVVHSPFEPNRSLHGFDYPKDALAILSWSRGRPMLETSDDNEVVFVYVEERERVGAAFVVRASDGWLLDELWTCPEG